MQSLRGSLTSHGAGHGQLVSKHPGKSPLANRGEVERSEGMHGLYQVVLGDPLQLCSLVHRASQVCDQLQVLIKVRTLISTGPASSR